MQSKVNSNPDGSYNESSYKNELNYEGWTRMQDGAFDTVPLGHQFRYLVHDLEKKNIKFRSGGFLVLNQELYLVYRAFNGMRFSLQKDRIVELWHRPIVRTKLYKTKTAK